MGSSKKIAKEALITFGLTTAKRLLSRNTVQSTVRGWLRKVRTGTREKPYQPVPAVERTAGFIVDALDGHLSDEPRLGIDGIAGSGKSTLGRSLARRLGLKWQTLYARQIDRPLLLETNAIYENIRLFRTQDVDLFDAIIYIDIPIQEAKARVMDRDRDGALVDVLDYERLKQIGDMAFDMANGDENRVPDSAARMKIRPEGGFGVKANLSAELKRRGLDGEGLSIEEMLFSCCLGEPKKGIMPYLKLGTYNQDILAGLLAGLLVAFDRLS